MTVLNPPYFHTHYQIATSDSDSDPAIIDMSTNAKLAMVESEVCIHTIVLILWWKYFTMYMYIDIL